MVAQVHVKHETTFLRAGRAPLRKQLRARRYVTNAG